MQRQALWLEAIERRIAATNAMLNSMKGVKMGGLTEVLRDDLQQLRVDELNISKKFRKLLIWTMGFCELSIHFIISPNTDRAQRTFLPSFHLSWRSPFSLLLLREVVALIRSILLPFSHPSLSSHC